MTLCTSLVGRTSWLAYILIVVLLSTLKVLQKSERSTENGITFQDLLKNLSAFPVTIGVTVLLISSITLISFWTRTIYGDMVPAALMSLNHTNGRYYMSNRYLNQQLTNLEQTLIRCSLPREGWTVKGRGCASALHSFNEITYQTDDWTKQLLRLKSWVISGNPERWMEFLRVWWTVIVFKCSHLFHLFDFFCLFVHYLFFFRKFNLFVHFDDLEWELKLHQ